MAHSVRTRITAVFAVALLMGCSDSGVELRVERVELNGIATVEFSGLETPVEIANALAASCGMTCSGPMNDDPQALDIPRIRSQETSIDALVELSRQIGTGFRFMENGVSWSESDPLFTERAQVVDGMIFDLQLAVPDEHPEIAPRSYLMAYAPWFAVSSFAVLSIDPTVTDALWERPRAFETYSESALCDVDMGTNLCGGGCEIRLGCYGHRVVDVHDITIPLDLEIPFTSDIEEISARLSASLVDSRVNITIELYSDPTELILQLRELWGVDENSNEYRVMYGSSGTPTMIKIRFDQSKVNGLAAIVVRASRAEPLREIPYHVVFPEQGPQPPTTLSPSQWRMWE